MSRRPRSRATVFVHRIPIDGSTIELTGTACDDLQSSGSTLTARFPCDVVIF